MELLNKDHEFIYFTVHGVAEESDTANLMTGQQKRQDKWTLKKMKKSRLINRNTVSIKNIPNSLYLE